MKPFEQYQAEWEANANKDPYWAVLTTKKQETKKWDRLQFFATAQLEIDHLYSYAKSRLAIPFQGAALDFGCGVGRITQALTRFFSKVVGVDISARMISEAHECAASLDSVEFVHNPHPHLQIFKGESFDFIYSNIVLQHIASRQQLLYLQEFGRILKPGGWAVIQIPSQKLFRTKWKRLKGTIGSYLPYKWKKQIQILLLGNRSKSLNNFDFEINLNTESEIEKTAHQASLEIVHLVYTNSCNPDFGGNLQFMDRQTALLSETYLSPMYFMKKQSPSQENP